MGLRLMHEGQAECSQTSIDRWSRLDAACNGVVAARPAQNNVDTQNFTNISQISMIPLLLSRDATRLHLIHADQFFKSEWLVISRQL